MGNIACERITIQDCLELFELKGTTVTIEDGNVTGFNIEEE